MKKLTFSAALFLAAILVISIPGYAQEWEALNRQATELYQNGQYDKAIVTAKKAVKAVEKEVGPLHPDVAVVLTSFAKIYDFLGRSAQAEPLYRRALSIREKAFGRDNLDVAESQNNLALFYYFRGRYEMAAPLLERSLAVREKFLGLGDPYVATSLENLTAIYRKLGRDDDANAYEKRSEAIRKEREERAKRVAKP